MLTNNHLHFLSNTIISPPPCVIKLPVIEYAKQKINLEPQPPEGRKAPSSETEVGQQEELFDRTLASRFILEMLLYELTGAAGRDAVAGRCHGEASTLRTIH